MRYLSIAIFQILFISSSGYFRRISWDEIDYHSNPASLSLRLSFFSSLAWLASIALAIWLSTRDKTNRSMIILFLVVLLPSLEFFLWFAMSF